MGGEVEGVAERESDHQAGGCAGLGLIQRATRADEQNVVTAGLPHHAPGHRPASCLWRKLAMTQRSTTFTADSTFGVGVDPVSGTPEAIAEQRSPRWPDHGRPTRRRFDSRCSRW
jgi:hypothetical protein